MNKHMRLMSIIIFSIGSIIKVLAQSLSLFYINVPELLNNYFISSSLAMTLILFSLIINSRNKFIQISTTIVFLLSLFNLVDTCLYPMHVIIKSKELYFLLDSIFCMVPVILYRLSIDSSEWFRKSIVEPIVILTIGNFGLELFGDPTTYHIYQYIMVYLILTYVGFSIGIRSLFGHNRTFILDMIDYFKLNSYIKKYPKIYKLLEVKKSTN